MKAVQGELYFLEKGLIFISKQPILIDFSKTDSISFSRVGGGVASARTFDMRVVSKTGGADHVFSAINKQEVGPISSFLQSKNIRLKNEMEEAIVDIDEPFSDDDEEMESPSEDERPSKAKNDKSKTKPVKKAADDDEDESGKRSLPLSIFSHTMHRLLTKTMTDDEDFEDESSDGGSPSESDSDDDSGMASDASDPMMEELRKKTQAKRTKAKETSGSGSENEKPKKKKAKKDDDE